MIVSSFSLSFVARRTTATSIRLVLLHNTAPESAGNLPRHIMMPPPSQSPSPPPDREGSPPRKRPRTRAPSQAAAVAAAATAAATPAPLASTATDISIPTQQTLVPEHNTATHRFSVQPINRFRGASASIKRPREVAHFSYDDNHEYRDDESSINYYIPPPMGADMREGFETFRHYEDKEDPHLDSLLKAVMKMEMEAGSQEKARGDFVTWRGMMTKVR